MLLEEFSLPPTVVQSAIQRSPIQANNFELKTVTMQMLQNIQFHGLPSENPNMHLTSFIEVCDTVKYNGVIKEIQWSDKRSAKTEIVPALIG